MPEMLGEFVKHNWEWFLILFGGILLLGAILGWEFAVTPARWEDKYRFHVIPWRVKTGAGGAVLMALGILLLLYSRGLL